MVDNPLNHKIEFIKGVGPNKAAALKKELGISQLKDMLDFSRLGMRTDHKF